MKQKGTDRAAWLVQHIIPVEPALRRWLSRYANTGLDIGDVVQETYAILANLESVAEIKNPRAYAFQTARSLILAHLRHARVISIVSVSDVDTLEVAAGEPSPEILAGDRDELRNVLQAVAGLPARVRQILMLRRVDGLSQREVAQRLGISENIVAKSVVKGVQAALAALSDPRKNGTKSRLKALHSEGSGERDILSYIKNKKFPF